MSGAACPACGEGGTSPACRVLLYAGCEKEVRACGSCGSMAVLPRPSAAEVAACYPPAYFHDFFRQYWQDYYKGRALALRLAAWRGEGDLMDAGCALGTMLAGARDHSRWRVRGLEPSAGAAELGRALNGVDIACAPLSAPSWPDGCLDYAHVNNVLEHESDPAAALSAVRLLLRPGGRLELVVPNGPVDLRPNLDLHRRLGGPVATKHGGHLSFFSRRGLEALLARCGFRTLSIRCFHFKLGLKARGWLPGAYRRFLEPPRGPAPAPGVGGPPFSGRGPAPGPMTLEEGRLLIPPAPSWPLYLLRQRARRLLRLSWTDFGYDFEVLAERE